MSPGSLFHFAKGAAHPLRQQFTRLFNRGEFARALEIALLAEREVTHDGPSVSLSLFHVASMKGAAHSAMGDLDKAQGEFEASLNYASNDQDTATAQMNLGAVCLRRGAYEYARFHFERGLERATHADALWSNLLIALWHLNAIEDVCRVLEHLSTTMDVSAASPLGVLLRHDSDLEGVRTLDCYKKNIDDSKRRN